MLRVYGVTFDHTTNYGTMMQSYALRIAVEKCEIGFEPCSYLQVPVSRLIAPKPNLPASLTVRLKRCLLKAFSWYRRRGFAEFEAANIRFADVNSREDLQSLNAVADVFICGSDVIWNCSFTGGETTYFLDFAEKYRFSYAASFGKADIGYEFDHVQLSESAEELYARMIPRLNAVGVREQNAVEIARRFTDVPVECVCDPVLLLSAEEWNNVIEREKTRGDRHYIFAYNTSVKPNFTAFLKKIAAQTGLPVVHVVWKPQDAFKEHVLASPSPSRWLKLLCEAAFVVTNSFHATAFSMLYHKTFFTVMQDGKSARTNVRLYDFLERIGMDSRIVTDTPETIDLSAPDFTEADRILAVQREESFSFLRRNLENASRIKNEGGKALSKE